MGRYLDNAATTPISETTKGIIVNALDIFGNPSSIHRFGEIAKELVDYTRSVVSGLINAPVETIYFTSGGCASNSLAIMGYVNNGGKSVIYSSTSHKSVLECMKHIKGRVSVKAIKVDNRGLFDMEQLTNIIKEEESPLIVVEYVNSETGVIHDIKKISEAVHRYGGILYVDCTGSIASIPLNVFETQIDMCGFSGHKIGALKGIGVLYKRENIKLFPLIFGSQEGGLFGGTENVVGISSLGSALTGLRYNEIESVGKELLWDFIQQSYPDSYVVGGFENKLPHTLCVCFPGVDAEKLSILLSNQGIAVSTGSACNNYTKEPSPTLVAMGIDEKDYHSCIRFSLRGDETTEELRSCVDVLINEVKRLKERD